MLSKLRLHGLTPCIAACLGALSVWLVGGLATGPASAEPGTQIQPEGGFVLRDGAGGEIMMRCTQGRPSWGLDPSQRALTFGFINTRTIAERQFENSSYKTEMSELQKERESALEELRGKGEKLAEDMKGLDRKSEEYKQLYDEYSKARKQYTDKEKEFNSRADQLVCKHLEQGLKDIRAAVEIVAARRGIDVVQQISPQDDRLPKSNLVELWRAIEAKVVLAFPKDLEITEDVIDELKLK